MIQTLLQIVLICPFPCEAALAGSRRGMGRQTVQAGPVPSCGRPLLASDTRGFGWGSRLIGRLGLKCLMRKLLPMEFPLLGPQPPLGQGGVLRVAFELRE